MSHTRFNPITRASSPEKIKGIKIPTPASGKVELLSDPILSALGEGVEIEEDVATRTQCKSNEEPVPGTPINQEGGCKKKFSQQDKDDAEKN